VSTKAQLDRATGAERNPLALPTKPESCTGTDESINPTSAKPQLSWPPQKARSIHQSHHQCLRNLPVWELPAILQLLLWVPDKLRSVSWKRDAGGACAEAGKSSVHWSTSGRGGDGTASCAGSSLANLWGGPQSSVPFPSQHCPETQGVASPRAQIPEAPRPSELRRRQLPISSKAWAAPRNSQTTPARSSRYQTPAHTLPPSQLALAKWHSGVKPTRRTSFQHTSRWRQTSLNERFANPDLAKTRASPEGFAQL